MKCPRCGCELMNGNSFELGSEIGDRRKAPRTAANSFTGPVLLTLPTVGNGAKQFEVRQSLVASLQEAYPAVDVVATLKEIKVWCDCNPKQRKTASGMPRFLNQWMAKEQNGRR